MSLRDRLLALLAGTAEEKPSPVKAPIIVREGKKDNAPATSPNTCLQCGGSLFVEITATVKRCAQCGHQGTVPPKRAGVPPTIVKPRAPAPSECPACGSSPLQQVGDGAGQWRCAACGAQSAAAIGNGLSREDLENYTGPPAHMQMNGASFYRALARMRGFGGR